MTPDQLRDFLDAAIRQQTGMTFLYCGLTILLSAGAGFLSAYLTTKGKNLATKEDVGEITTKIEATKAEFTERLAVLKSELASRGYYSQIRYEREVKVFTELWPIIYKVSVALHKLMPHFSGDMERDLQDPTTKPLYQEFLIAHSELHDAVWNSRPFYPQEIWNELNALLNLFWDRVVGFKIKETNINRFSFWTTIKDNKDKIDVAIDRVCEAIRKRLTDFDKAR
jgi:hypothetical protein